MPPLPIHEQPAAHLAKAVDNFTEAIPYDRLLIDVTMHLNHHIQNKDSTNIPDLQCCHIPYIHASCPDFGIQIQSGPILRSASDPIYDKLPKFISCSFNVITAYSFIRLFISDSILSRSAITLHIIPHATYIALDV
jgi:hypothetical protein